MNERLKKLNGGKNEKCSGGWTRAERRTEAGIKADIPGHNTRFSVMRAKFLGRREELRRANRSRERPDPGGYVQS